MNTNYSIQHATLCSFNQIQATRDSGDIGFPITNHTAPAQTVGRLKKSKTKRSRQKLSAILTIECETVLVNDSEKEIKETPIAICAKQYSKLVGPDKEVEYIEGLWLSTAYGCIIAFVQQITVLLWSHIGLIFSSTFVKEGIGVNEIR